MKLIVAVKDRAIDAFGQPFFVHATGQAVRSFIDEVNNRESPFNAHPEDYDLYEIGSYNEDTGEILPIPPRLLGRGQDVHRPTNDPTIDL